MYHNKGPCLWVVFALFDGFRLTRHDVAQVIIWDFSGAQGKLGHNVSVVCDPLSSGRLGSSCACGVCCYNTHTHTNTTKLPKRVEPNCCGMHITLTVIWCISHRKVHFIADYGRDY